MSKIPGIQALRALAAIMVLIGHVIAETRHYFGIALPFSGLPWSRGVDIFFVISGFIITLSAQRLWGQPDAARQFLWRRFIRVVPLYYLFTSLMVAALFAFPGGVKNTQLDPVQIITSYLFIPYARYDGRIAPVLSLGWTLNYEMFFYGIVAITLVLPGRFGLNAVILVISGLSTIGLIFAPELTAFSFWTNPTIMAFVFGVLIARAHLAGLAPQRGGVLVLALGLGMLIALNALAPEMPRFVTSGLPAAIIVSAPVLFSTQSYALPTGLLLGDASYALYLSHRFVLRAGTLLLVPLLPATSAGAVGFFILMSMAALFVSVGVFQWIESPMLRAMRSAR